MLSNSSDLFVGSITGLVARGTTAVVVDLFIHDCEPFLLYRRYSRLNLLQDSNPNGRVFDGERKEEGGREREMWLV